MGTLTLPLFFGNITLALAVLMVTLVVLFFVVEGGIKVVKLTLALDSEDAPDIKIKNPLDKLFSLVAKGRVELVKIEGWWGGEGYVYKDKSTGKYYDRMDCKWWDKPYSPYETKEDALKADIHIPLEFHWTTVVKILTVGIILDTILMCLGLYFVATIAIVLTVTTMYCVRTLAKRVYSGMKKNSNRIDNHDKDIEELKNK